MKIGATFEPADRAAWRHWLEQHHASKSEIWLLSNPASNLTYLESVEEALCFGWIDGLAKRVDACQRAQRFTPRRLKSHWTELNKLRAQRLIAEGRMAPAGFAVLPNLAPDAFQVPLDIIAALQADRATWENFQAFSEDYKRIRIGYIEEMRARPAVFKTRLNNFLKKTQQNKLFGVLR